MNNALTFTAIYTNFSCLMGCIEELVTIFNNLLEIWYKTTGTNLITACKLDSVSKDLFLDLLLPKQENASSQMYVKPNTESIVVQLLVLLNLYFC